MAKVNEKHNSFYRQLLARRTLLPTILLLLLNNTINVTQAKPYLILNSSRPKCIETAPFTTTNNGQGKPVTISITYEAPNVYGVDPGGHGSKPDMDEIAGIHEKIDRSRREGRQQKPGGGFGGGVMPGSDRSKYKITDITISLTGKVVNSLTGRYTETSKVHHKTPASKTSYTLTEKSGTFQLEIPSNDRELTHYHHSLERGIICIQSFHASKVKPSFIQLDVKEVDHDFQAQVSDWTKQMDGKRKEAVQEKEDAKKNDEKRNRVNTTHLTYLERQLLEMIRIAKQVDRDVLSHQYEYSLFHDQSEKLLRNLMWFPFFHWLILIGVSIYQARSVISYLKKKMVIY